MSHDETKVLLGTTKSSDKEGVSAFNSDPATYEAGLAVRQSSTAGVLSLIASAGKWVGISLGKSLSDTKKTSVIRAGEGVPVLLEAKPATGAFTIDDYTALVSGTDDSITIGATTFTFQTGAVTPGAATIRAATSEAATAASCVSQINAHATAGALVEASIDPNDDATVILTAKSNTSAGNTIAFAYTDNDGNEGISTGLVDYLEEGGEEPDFVVIGEKVYFSDTTGKADNALSDSTISDAVYVSGVLTGVKDDGTEVWCALIDMPGGL